MAKFIEDIKNNYRKLEHELVTQLSYQVEHNVTTGTNREEIWIDFFRRIIPKKFNIARSVFIIDSNSKCSKEVDIAIYDEQYTPYIFNYGNIKFIPIEAVASVVQCKSKQLDIKSLLDWTESIANLKTSQDSIVRLANYIHIGIDKYKDKKTESIQIATTPIKILCYISEKKTETKTNKGKDSFDIIKDSFDIIIEAYQNDKENIQDKNFIYSGNLNIIFRKKDNNDINLYDVLCQYNRNNEDYNKHDVQKKLKERTLLDYTISNDEEEKYTLLSFIFQFNQMLMLINNPMFFPHMAYVKMFDNKKRGDGE